MKLFYVDTETTGTDPAKHAIIQIAGMVVIDGAVMERFEFFLAPHEGAAIEDRALEVNGRTREEIAAFPPAAEAYRALLAIMGRHVDKFARSDKFHFVGYNARFDMDMLRALWERFGDKYFGSWFFFPALDVMTMAAVALMRRRHKMPDFKLSTVAAELGLALPENLHDALADIELTRDVFRDLMLIEERV